MKAETARLEKQVLEFQVSPGLAAEQLIHKFLSEYKVGHVSSCANKGTED